MRLNPRIDNWKQVLAVMEAIASVTFLIVSLMHANARDLVLACFAAWLAIRLWAAGRDHAQASL